MRAGLAGTLLGALVFLASSAGAQTRSVRGYFTYGAVQLASHETFDAVAGSHRVMSLAGGAQATNLWRSLFVDVSVGRQSVDGERVLVAGGEVFPLGIPLAVRLYPVDVVGGWRFATRRYSPYAGVGVASILYRESSGFARPGDDVKARATGLVALAGVDVPAWRFVSIGGEVRYRSVAGVLGESGASAVFDENALGGLQYSLRISIR